LNNLFALACEVLNPVKRFEIHLVLDLGSKKGQVIIVSTEGCFGVSFQENQEGLVCEVILADLDVMPTDDSGVLGTLFDGGREAFLSSITSIILS